MSKIRTWNPGMSDKETADLAYWERNALALYYADGWYNDDVHTACTRCDSEINAWICVFDPVHPAQPRYKGWRRVLSLEGGKITFHIPDDFDVGDLAEVAPNWDGHTTEEKWRRVLDSRGINA